MSLTLATYSMIDGAPVNVLDFGAVGDGVANDTAAVQAAIDFCLASTQARTLVIPSQCYLGSSLTIDRLVDTTTSEFRIVGMGPNAGFKVNGINAFTSTLAPVGGQPQSEYVTFEGIRFDGNANVASFAFTERFLRMRFLNCDFAGIRGLNATTFAQEWSFERCRVRNAPAAFFSSQGAYYVNSHGSKYQNNTGTIFAINHPTFATGVVGCSFVQDTVEANSVGWLRAGQIYGLLIAGIYSEKNDLSASSTPLINLSGAFGATNRGVSITGSQFDPTAANQANTNFYDIVWGQGGGFSAGNNCLGNLHDNSATSQIDLVVNADAVAPGKKLMRSPYAQVDLVPDPTSGYASKVTAAFVVAYPINGVQAHTIALPPPVAGGRVVRIQNRLSNPSQSFTVLPSYSADGSVFRGGVANAGFIQGPGITVDYTPTANGTYDITQIN